MSVTAQTPYNSNTFDLLEDGGLVLGLLTLAQWIDLANLSITDLATQAAVQKDAYTQQIEQGVSRYTVPDSLMRVDLAFCAGRLLNPTTVTGLNSIKRGWRNAAQAIPAWWHEDEIPNRMIEIWPPPNYTGSSSDVGTGFYLNSHSPAVHRNLTLVGPTKPAAISVLGNPIPVLPADVATGYLGFGILARIFSGDSELKDPQRALYCAAQLKEGIALLQSIMSEAE